MAFGGGLRRNSGGELKLYLKWKRNTRGRLECYEQEHIVQIYDVKYFAGAMWIIMEYCDLGDLNKLFGNYENVPEDDTRKIELMRQIAKGLAFLHDRRIVHRDLKPDNIFVKSRPNLVIKLGDFGLSKVFEVGAITSTMNSHLGTPNFQAPELWAVPTQYHTNVDIYAAGLTFMAMIHGRMQNGRLMPKAAGSLYLYETELCIGQAAHLRQLNHLRDFNVIEDATNDTETIKKTKNLIRKMTHINPDERPKASEVVDHLADLVGTESVTFNVQEVTTEEIVDSGDDSEAIYIHGFGVNFLQELGRGRFGTVYIAGRQVIGMVKKIGK